MDSPSEDRISAHQVHSAPHGGSRRWLAETDVQHLLLILDLCYAGQTVVDAGRFDEDLPESWLVLASATRNQQAVTGGLTQAITEFLDELASDIGRKYGRSPSSMSPHLLTKYRRDSGTSAWPTWRAGR